MGELVRAEVGTHIAKGRPYEIRRTTEIRVDGWHSDWRVKETDDEIWIDPDWVKPIDLPTEPTWGGTVSRRADFWVEVQEDDALYEGQPYRVEYDETYPADLKAEADMTAQEGIVDRDMFAGMEIRGTKRFVDSTWVAPLKLPTEPTWGIPLVGDDYPDWIPGNWHVVGDELETVDGDWSYPVDSIKDFIQFTPEQVKQAGTGRHV